ncbi:NTP transferase domain-containing protein [Staphylococcus massiliensis]|uniref:Bifunctional protein GlmU n=1 Tax=Staphylococcus massiliensis S46 TaxID=1229783 RepID=K9AXA2_9STAP|nr:NTP transferase domain-containing protein [Staphylococcus massiliensis]EKU46155.1 bifunctional N-acetylglucosamine-1-phosphate uridyltransferase/glucosamine-1-phosphate acetyltransferase [Staphylococcus massiliensis S46]MCG3400536.1 NTP transferase domain-containing protein [Staphylococcus massiliensis]MCG3402806.1 NTP transferase domain-containing protein [Staphylococcus massiliensis]MCG3413203.1 NTP transferase domain-containing protein [Staphylococcus massiliensis]POA01954.1 bifunctional
MQKNAVILATDKSEKMKSKKQDVLHKVAGKTMIEHVVGQVKQLELDNIVTVVDKEDDKVQEIVQDACLYAQGSSNDNVLSNLNETKANLKDQSGMTLIVSGNAPLLTKETLKAMMAFHEQEESDATILTTVSGTTEYKTRYVYRDEHGMFEAIKPVGKRDAFYQSEVDYDEIEDELGLSQDEVDAYVDLGLDEEDGDAGVYVFNTEKLIELLEQVNFDNETHECDIYELVNNLKDKDGKVSTMDIDDFLEPLNITQRSFIGLAEKELQLRINHYHLNNGVTIVDTDTTYIGPDVTIGMDTIIEPGAKIMGQTVIGEDVVIGQYSEITNSEIKDGAQIKHSVVTDAIIGEKSKIGPFAQLRPGTNLGQEVKIGNFVETKKATLDDGAKVSHLSYIGDAEIGARTNIGCGSITVNYDGVNKFKTIVGKDAFIGCNTNLVAPVSVGDNTLIAAGSTITDDVPQDSLALARSRQTTKDGYLKDRK